jgi:phosphate starvation-inducible PhoH-like protein
VRAIRTADVVFGVGPAGTGKTYLAVGCALSAFAAGVVSRIILVRPVVEAGERLGFLPGDIKEKVNPYMRPLYDALQDMMEQVALRRLMEEEVIEIAPLAYMRGRTLNKAFVILDEAQNTTIEQMKMFLTRMGLGSRMVITGDVTQIDLPRETPSGLVNAARILAGIPDIRIVNFLSADVVRHELVRRILGAYEDKARIGGKKA